MNTQLLKKIAERIFRRITESGTVFTCKKEVSEETAKKIISEMLITEYTISQKSKEAVTEMVLERMFGLGSLEALLRSPEINEIMVNGKEQTFVENKGRLERSDVTFSSDQEIIHIINRIVAPLGRRIDESSPIVDGRLPDGSRVNAIISPLSRIGPVLTIRKFPKKSLSLEDMLQKNSIDAPMLAYLDNAVTQKKNIVIAGGTSSGKTSTLNALVNRIPTYERIITIEDAAEIQTSHPHRIPLESRQQNLEGKGAVTIRTLLKNALRMRPDRIIIGEVRAEECLDMLQAMNTGHKGSLCTVHANSEKETLIRMETMALMGNVDIPLRALRQQIISAIDLIVYQERLTNGQRKIRSISEVIKTNTREYEVKQCIA